LFLIPGSVHLATNQDRAQTITQQQTQKGTTMKTLSLIVLITIAALFTEQAGNPLEILDPGLQKADTTISNPHYDKALAEKLGADDYGMKSYFLVILKTGTNTSADKELTRESFRGHLDNINRLVDEGKLIVAGPLGQNENQYRGIFILDNIATADDAKELLLTDPAIKNGFLGYEIFPWYGSAALPEYLPASDKIWKEKP
jgi:uncharacterized protein YciI